MGFFREKGHLLLMIAVFQVCFVLSQNAFSDSGGQSQKSGAEQASALKESTSKEPTQKETAQNKLIDAERAAAKESAQAALAKAGAEAAEIKAAFNVGADNLLDSSLDVTQMGQSWGLVASQKNHKKQLVCTLCTRLEVLEAARTLGVVLNGLATETPPGMLVVKGIPKTGTLEIDGQKTIASSDEKAAGQGGHRVTVRTDGELIETTVSVTSGTTTELIFRDTRLNYKNLRRSIGFAGGGVGLVVAGALLWSFHGNCSSSVEDQEGNCRDLANTAPFGIGLLSTGIVSIVTGVVFAFMVREPADFVVLEGLGASQ